MMKKLLLVIVVAVIAYIGYVQQQSRSSETLSAETAEHPSRLSEAPVAEAVQSDSALTSAFENHASNVQVQGQGTVIKILPDDNDGSRHQRFIIRLDSGQTLLIAHNIDLASRVSPLSEGNTIEFSGEYEWNSKGGVVHWTHHDPSGRHPAGWLKHDGRMFQ